MLGFFGRKKRKRFGEIAVSRGLASEEDIKRALEKQQEYIEKHRIHKQIGAILTEQGVLAPEDVRTVLQAQKGPAGITAWFYALFGLSR